MDELADLYDDAIERPAILTVSLKRTVDDFPGNRADDGRPDVVADNPRGCRV
jgi:hypothetical protein